MRRTLVRAHSTRILDMLDEVFKVDSAFSQPVHNDVNGRGGDDYVTFVA